MMNWEDILKNIQISGQKGKTKDIRLPPKEEDEDCKPWFERLFSLCDDFLEDLGKVDTYVGNRLQDFTNEQLCQAKKEILLGETSIFDKELIFKHGPFEGRFTASPNHVKFYLNSNIYGQNRPFIEITVSIYDVEVYAKGAYLEYDISETYVASDAIIDLVSLMADITKHINMKDDGINKSLTLGVRYLHGKYVDWYNKNLSKAIQIGRQKGKTKDIRLPPKEDDYDCRQWWRDLHKILNKMVSAIDMNATLIIDSVDLVETIDKEKLCEGRDKIMNAEAQMKSDNLGFEWNKSTVFPMNSVIINTRGMFSSEPDEQSNLSLFTYCGVSPTTFRNLFRAKVKLLNDSMIAQLERSVPQYPEAYVYDILEKFIDAELELKEHVNDKTMSLDMSAYLIEYYEDYVREHFDISKSIQIGRQKGKTKDIRLPPKVEDDNCIKKLIAMSKKIENFRDERFLERNAMVKDDSLFWVGDLDLSQKPYTRIPNNPDLLEVNWEGLDTITEEEACHYLELLERYKNTPNIAIAERNIIFEKNDYADVAGIMITNDDVDSDNYLLQFGILIQIREGLDGSVIDEIIDIMTP